MCIILKQGKLIQASDLKSETVKSRARPLSARRELHGYDGPMLYLNQGSNPDAMTTVQVSVPQNKCNLFTAHCSIQYY